MNRFYNIYKYKTISRLMCTSILKEKKLSNGQEQFNEFHKENHVNINLFQKSLLTVGSAMVSLFDPSRPDMIACLGETSGDYALVYMRKKMQETQEGIDILENKPRINTKTVDYEKLKKMPENTLGRVYFDFVVDMNLEPDKRSPVQFVDDIELAYVMQRYREIHDIIHAALKMKTHILGEVAVKWVEGLQTKLPMCIGGAIFGAARLKTKHRSYYLKTYLPWAHLTGTTAKFLQAVYFERRWEQPLDEFCTEMNIIPYATYRDSKKQNNEN